MAQIKVLHYFFDLGVPARRRELRHICTHNPMPPRRRAFRSNDFGLKPTTIPRDTKRQAEPPSRQGRITTKIISTAIPHACPSDPTPVSRRATNTLVSTFSRAAIIPRTQPSQGLQRYRALAPDGAAQGNILSFLYCPGGTPSQ